MCLNYPVGFVQWVWVCALNPPKKTRVRLSHRVRDTVHNWTRGVQAVWPPEMMRTSKDREPRILKPRQAGTNAAKDGHKPV